MASTLLALAWPGAASGPLDPFTALVSFAVALVFTGAVGWWAHRLERARIRRERAALAEASPVGGVH